MRYLILAIVVSPALSYAIYRVAKGLGFLDPPWNEEHEHRRTIVVAMYAFLLFIAIFLFGHAHAWPRVWAIFGMVNAVALIVFAAIGVSAAWKLWRLRHPRPEAAAGAPAASEAAEDPAEKPIL